MKVEQFTSASGNPVANQFTITRQVRNGVERTFQSYNSLIVRITGSGMVKLDETYWNYSRTTAKYRSAFLGESTAETRAKIEAGEYKLVNLN